MANNWLDTRYKRTKCSGSRKGPPLRSWMWCILIKCFVGLPCIFSECLGVNVTVSISPPGTIFVKYGSPLEVYCTAEMSTADDIVFKIGGQVLESEKINRTTRRLYIEKPERNFSTLHCYNKKSDKICATRLVVDSPPASVTDFNCISRNLEVLNCSWTHAPTYSVINDSVTFVIKNVNKVSPPCLVNTTGTRYCTWGTASQPRYRQQEETQYFYMKSCNVFDCITQNFTIDHLSIVKPDPPIELKYFKNSTHSVLLKWKIPNNMVDLLTCGVDHIIEYQIAKIDNTTQFHRVNTSSLPPRNKTYRFQLNDLPYAFTQYEVRVYIKTKKAEKRQFWSDYSYVVFKTASERPNRPPDLIAGGFDAAVYDDKRIIYLYWKQIEEYEEAGPNFTYKVHLTQGNKSLPVIYADKNKSLSYVVINNLPLEALNVNVWSYNINGTSVNSSQLYIPSVKDTQSLHLTSFTKLAYENGTYELSWVGLRNIDNYTLFWCQHNATAVCSGRLDYAILNPKKSTHVIDLPKEYRYQFALAANNGSSTSGMVWAKCDISKDGFVMYSFPVDLQYDAPGKSFVRLRWKMDCAIRDGIITGYNISYCPIVQTSSYCDKSVEKKEKIITDPKTMNVLIENLLPFRTYQFTLAINTTYGQKNIENATAVITTSEDTPTMPINVAISNITNESLLISWDPPLQRNGNIGKYVIYNYSSEFYVDEVSGTDISRRQVTLSGLQHFKNYSFTVQACNIPINLCSKTGPAIFVRTRIGSPFKMKAPSIESDFLTWHPPEGKSPDMYQIKVIKDDKEGRVINVTNVSLPSLSVSFCQGVVLTEKYLIRAINFDEDLNYGALGNGNVTLPVRPTNSSRDEFPGDWSEPTSVTCRSKGGLTMTLIFVGIFFVIGMVYGSIRIYKKYRKMEDIKPVLPNGLGIPEKDISKYAFGWNPTNKEEKPPSDEMLLLPDIQAKVPAPELKQKDDNCAASDHTDSTALSDSSRGPVDRQVSTSDDDSNSSLHLEIEPVKTIHKDATQDQESLNADTESLQENSPYLAKTFAKNPTSGYVQPVVNPTTGYVQSAPEPMKSSPPTTSSQPASSSYVMAALPPSIFTTGVTQPAMTPKAQSGYVLAEETQPKSMMNFPNLGLSPTKVLGPESLPSMPNLPPPAKHGAENSYIQLQSLNALPNLKQSVGNNVPLKPPTSSGYVSPGDVVINKHLNNMLSGQLTDESAILDPTMSPDAYCRFSWSTDPVNDNLHSLLTDSTTRSSSKN